jgi:hypothetical protein
MIKILVIGLLFALFSHTLNAQLFKLRRFEVSGGIGTTQIYGDIGGYSSI